MRVPIFVAGAAANAIAYALSRWAGFGIVAAGCAAARAIQLAVERALAGLDCLDCCPHPTEADTAPFPVVVSRDEEEFARWLVRCAPEWEARG